MRRGFLAALGVIVVANLGALAAVVHNQSGAPEAAVWLDERELELLPGDRDNSGRLMHLRYQNAPSWDDRPLAPLEDSVAPQFLDQSTLEALGFDCSVAPGHERAAEFYRRALPRPAFVVFAVGGPEWERQVAAWQARNRLRTEARIASGELTGEFAERARQDVAEAPQRLSRLMPIDVGSDPAALRVQHPDRERALILPGVVALRHIGPSQPGGPALRGRLVQVFPSVLSVPRELAAPLATLPEPPRRRPAGTLPRWRAVAMLEHAPRYEVGLSVGRGLRPWITRIRVWPP